VAPTKPRVAEETCRIFWWRGYVKSAFVAATGVPEGAPRVIAQSPLFKWRGNETPDRREDIVAAHQALVDHLIKNRWKPTGVHHDWFEQSFSRKRER
jgi:hypothetical protein